MKKYALELCNFTQPTKEKETMGITRNVFLLCLVLMVSGCAATTIVVPRMKPAEINLAGVKKIAVATIDGEGGVDLADELIQSLMQSGRYEVVDRQHLTKIQQEQALGASGIVDTATAAKIGKIAGVDALIFGRVGENHYNEKVTHVVGTKVDGTGAKTNYTAYTRIGIHRLRVSAKVVDTTSGRILATKMLEAEASQKKEATVDEPPTTDSALLEKIIPPIENVESAAGATRKKVVEDFMKMIAPYKVMVGIILYDESKLPSTKTGVAYAQSGDWNAAIEQFRMAVNQADGGGVGEKVKGRAHYNLGVALGYSGQYDKGIEEVRRAHSIYQDSDFLIEIQKLEGYKNDDARLQQQMKETEETSPPKTEPSAGPNEASPTQPVAKPGQTQDRD
jgi:hypothetical protein